MSEYYESDRAVAEYLLFHYGDDDQVLPWPAGPREALGFPRRCVRECLIPDRLPPRATTRALDLGCAVGASTFELARHAAEVVGLDRSERFIAVARALLEHGEAAYEIPVEGSLSLPAVARRPEVPPAAIRFAVADALHLPPELGTFDLILAANLLDRVPRPRDLLRGLAARLRPGGQLILTSPYTWLREYTPPGEWLCDRGRPTGEVLAEHLPGLELARRLDLPFLIREHVRKYQWSVAEATVWVRPAAGNRSPAPGA